MPIRAKSALEMPLFACKLRAIMEAKTQIGTAQSGAHLECPACRRAMRLWALGARRPENADVRDICLSTAKAFRDGPCFHAPNNEMTGRA